MSVVVFSPVLLCAMQGDPAVAGVDAPVAEDQARKDAAVYDRAIESVYEGLICECKRADGHACPQFSKLDNYGGALGNELRALLLPRGDEHKKYAVCLVRAFVYGFATYASHWLGHDATPDEALRGLIEAKKRRDEATK